METRKVLLFNAEEASSCVTSGLRELGWEPQYAADIQSAERMLLQHEYRVGLIYLNVNRPLALHQIEELLLQNRPTKWIALLPLSPAHCPHTCRIVRDYFFDYHTLPLDRDRLFYTLGHAYGMANVMYMLRDTDNGNAKLDEEMVGTNASMLNLFRSIRKVAKTDAAVLISGESGTGKELAARAVHERSNRANGPFVAVNCGALSANLVQTELFGYEKGAFTGAAQRRMGSIEAAIGGTIFLDEIGDLPLDMQVNLLRFLQEKVITRVGGTEAIPVDVRVIAATHVDLEKAIEAGRFREDLFYRLNVLHLQVPPLRERREDIEVLAKYFFQKFSNEKNSHVKGFSQHALKCMENHSWPGNVRELINRVRRALVMSEHRLITPVDLGLERRGTERRILKLGDAREIAEKKAIQSALRFVRGNHSQAARELGISRVTLYRLMEKYQLKMVE